MNSDTLCRLFNFTRTDLYANQAGQFSDWQMESIAGAARFSNWSSLIFMPLFFGVIGFILGAGSDNNTYLLGGIGLGLLFDLLLYWRVRQTQERLSNLMVEQISGVVSVHAYKRAPDLNNPHDEHSFIYHQMRIGDKEFNITSETYELLKEQAVTLTVYYVHSSDTGLKLLSAQMD